MAIESGWIHDPVPKHYCITPTDTMLAGHFEGAIWKCGDCGMHWEIYWDTKERKKELRTLSPSEAEARMAVASPEAAPDTTWVETVEIKHAGPAG